MMATIWNSAILGIRHCHLGFRQKLLLIHLRFNSKTLSLHLWLLSQTWIQPSCINLMNWQLILNSWLILMKSSILNSAIFDSAIFAQNSGLRHLVQSDSNSDSFSLNLTDGSSILELWLILDSAILHKKNLTSFILTQLDEMAAILNSAMLDSDTAILDSNTLLSSLRFTEKHSSLHSDSESN